MGVVMDKDFGTGYRMAATPCATACGSSATSLPDVADYLLLYANDKPRFLVRQNVISDIEPFIGRSRRERVCALVKGDIETSSDYDGVVSTRSDREGDWRMKLVQEFKAASFGVGANRALQQ